MKGLQADRVIYSRQGGGAVVSPDVVGLVSQP